jgi:hypothetical protein
MRDWGYRNWQGTAVHSVLSEVFMMCQNWVLDLLFKAGRALHVFLPYIYTEIMIDVVAYMRYK